MIDLIEKSGPVIYALALCSLIAMAVTIERLPADCPEPTLILRVRMVYPKIRPR